MTDKKDLRLMAVHAHPDDEVFATGGVLAKAAADGLHTILVTCTRGEEGEIHDPALDPEEARPRLAQIRTEELKRAAEILGIGEQHFLDYHDSGMEGAESNSNPTNFWNADLHQATGRLVKIIRQTRPHVLITYNERGGYGHPDHIRAHEVTVAAFAAAGNGDTLPEIASEPWQPAKLYYAVFMRSGLLRLREVLRERGLPIPFEDADIMHFTSPDEVVTTRVDVAAYVPQKMAAIQAHRTQLAPDHPMLSLPDDVAEQVWRVEAFTLISPSIEWKGREETDLFDGL